MDKTINLTVDRIVDGVVTLIGDDESVFFAKPEDFPAAFAEGDIWIIKLSGESLIILEKNEADMSARSERINSLFNKLKNKSKQRKEDTENEN